MTTENSPALPAAIKRLVELRRVQSPPVRGAGKATLRERFLLPPFSVLDARQGYWQDRKRAWLELGIESELGRGVNLGDVSAAVAGITDPAEVEKWNEARRIKKRLDDGLLGISKQARSHYRGTEANTFNSGRPGDLQQRFQVNAQGTTMQPGRNGRTGSGACEDGTEVHPQSGTSIFDPVLCELAYRWFSPKGGSVLDPFAGGSVRGIMAAQLGRSYTGVDLREEQVEANYQQAERICPTGDVQWIVGDSTDIQHLTTYDEPNRRFDFLFSCPPYADLERYSDDPRDLSTMEYRDFLQAYRTIIQRSCFLLKDDRFACFVVGDIRDRKTGSYRNFVGDTITAFLEAGLTLYNEAILVTAVGSLAIRVGAQFRGYRKLGKAHQNVLVFLKGDAGRASDACGDVDVADLQMPSAAEGKIAVCAQDCVGFEHLLEGSEGDLSDCAVLPGSLIEAALLCDILRGEARQRSASPPRAWLGTRTGWQRLEEDVELTYLVGDTPYFSRTVFPNAALPSHKGSAAQRMRRAGE